jgi:DNA-binding MurR/RpiR family transcriptional regulator
MADEPDETNVTAFGYARPSTYEELLAVLSSGADALPRRLREVAVHVTQHPDSVALGTISSVAAEIGVQPSTLVRFGQVLGFSGFSDLQEVFKSHLRGSVPAAEGSSHLAMLAAAARASLARLATELPEDALHDAARLLAAAPVPVIVGMKRAFPVASYLSLGLSQHGIRNVLIDNAGGLAQDQMAVLGPADVVVAVSFSPYNSITPELARIAHGRGARVLALTDSPLSPLIPVATVPLVVVEAVTGGYRTLTATMITALALVREVADLQQAGL